MAKKVKDTSVEAFRSLEPKKLSEIYKKILYALSVLQEATTEEVAAFMKVQHDRVWKRFSELVTAKLITTANKRPLKSGRLGYTYVLLNPPKTEKEAMAFKEMALPSTGKTDSKTAASTKIEQATLF